MSRILVVQYVPYRKNVFVLRTDCMDEGSFRYCSLRQLPIRLVMQMFERRANRPLGLLIQNTLQVAHRWPRLLETGRGIECSEFRKEKKASKNHRFYYDVFYYDVFKWRPIEGARVSVRRSIEDARVAALRTAPIDDSEDGVSNFADTCDDFGSFDLENVFGDDLSDCENTSDDEVGERFHIRAEGRCRR